jgi:hypothetical protein
MNSICSIGKIRVWSADIPHSLSSCLAPAASFRIATPRLPHGRTAAQSCRRPPLGFGFRDGEWSNRPERECDRTEHDVLDIHKASCCSAADCNEHGTIYAISSDFGDRTSAMKFSAEGNRSQVSL